MRYKKLTRKSSHALVDDIRVSSRFYYGQNYRIVFKNKTKIERVKLWSFEFLVASNLIMVEQKYILGEISARLRRFSFSKKAFKGYGKNLSLASSF